MLTFVLLAGLWSTDCTQTQTQTQSNRGWVKDSYLITETGDYTFARTWFKEETCTNRISLESEDGQLKLGKAISGMFAAGSTEVDFISEKQTNLGAMKIEGNVLKVARSLSGSSTRNTMLAIIGFQKKKSE